MGRWISTDPKEQFFDLYSYAGNGYNPIACIDEDGNFTKYIVTHSVAATYGTYYWNLYGPRVGNWLTNTWTRFGRFFYDPRPFRVISQEYWARMGGANGASLHHWLIPQRWNFPIEIQNAGFNLMNLPAFKGVFHPTLGLNQWMGFASRWGGSQATAAAFVENSIRIGIPTSIAASVYIGSQIGEPIFSDNSPSSSGALNDLRLDMNVDMDKLTNFED